MTDSADLDSPRIRRRTDHCVAARAALLVLPLALAQIPSARAGHPLATDDVGTQGAGAVEVEVSGLAERTPDAEGDLAVGLGVALHAGVGERIDLGVTTAWAATPGAGGSWESAMADPVLDLKWRISDGRGALPGLAVRADYEPPQSAADSHGHDAGTILLATWERELYAASVNLGALGTDLETSDASWCVVASAGGLLALTARLLAGGEIVAELDRDGIAAASSTAAMVWEAGRHYALSLGVGVSRLEPDRTGWIATVALTSGFGGRQ